MTDQQITDQLRRLKPFGNIGKIELEGYIMALRNHDYTYLVRAVDWLIVNHQYKSFPLPAEIIKRAKMISADENQLKEQYKYSDYNNISQRVNGAFAAAFSSLWGLSKSDFNRLNKKLMAINNKYGDDIDNEDMAIQEMRQIKAEAMQLLNGKEYKHP